jgi:antitoxin (DNA-binding transcriptional repressor) of toxin-antitoxin stability system
MTTTVNIYEAKTNLSKLLLMVEQGQDITIKRFNKVIAVITKPKPQKQKLNIGVFDNDPGYWIADDFDDEDPQILKMFGIID